MRKNFYRTYRGYDGVQLTSHKLVDILPYVLQKIGRVYGCRADLILAAWPEVIGDKLDSMTQAVSFEDGVLFVKVKNSTLHSLLSQNYRSRILKSLRNKFPGTEIKNIVFRIG